MEGRKEGMGEEAMMAKKGESWPAAGSSPDFFQSSQIEIGDARAGVLCARPCPCARLVGRILFSPEDDRW